MSRIDELTWILVILGLIATTQLMERFRSLRLIRDGIKELPNFLRRETKLFQRTRHRGDRLELQPIVDLSQW